VGDAVAAVCAQAILRAANSAPNAIKNFFIMIFAKWIFQSCNWLWHSCITRSRVKSSASVIRRPLTKVLYQTLGAKPRHEHKIVFYCSLGVGQNPTS